MSESSVASVRIPPALRACVGGHEEVLVSGDTVGDLLEAVGHEYPSLIAKVISADGALAPGMQLYLGGSSIADLMGLATPVALEEVLSIVPTTQL
jgi:molybdopterin converting factor small subunit